MKKIYFDAVSSTNVDPEVLSTYKNILDKYYCNSDALYDDGVAIYDMQEKSREIISNLLGVKKEEIIFTSGSSESNSTAIKSVCLASERRHIVTTVEEHHSLLNSVKQLEEHFGFEVTYLKPNKDGVITAEEVKDALRSDTILVSIMACNNEIGLINDIQGIKKIVKKHPGTYFHTDLTQAIGKMDIDLSDVDLASISAHKIHGLKGSGILVKRKHVPMLPLISGGQQEFGLRGGTSNAPANIVLAKTLRLALERQSLYHDYLVELHNYFVCKLENIKEITINSKVNCIPSLINISTPIKSEVMLNALNLKGIMVSSKSTCGSRKNDENMTLETMDIDPDTAIRISFDYTNNKEEIDYFIDCIKEIIDKYA